MSRPTRYARAVIRTVLILVLGMVVLRGVVLELYPFPATSDEVKELSALFNGSLVSDFIRLNEMRAQGIPSHFGMLAKRTVVSLSVVVLALVWSTAIALWFGILTSRRPHPRWLYLVDGVLTFLGGIPLFCASALVYFWFYEPISADVLQARTWYPLATILVGGVVLGSVEGALGKWPRYYRSLFSEVRSSTFYTVMTAHGQKVSGVLYRSAQPYLIRGLSTRLSYLFGGIVILEFIARIPGIGSWFLIQMRSNLQPISYHITIFSGLLILAIPVITKMIVDVASIGVVRPTKRAYRL